MVLAQLFVPAKMIVDSERVIQKGKVYKFKLRPIDPNDPFRGKYMTLAFEEDNFKTDTCENAGWKPAFIYIDDSNSGYAKIKTISYEKLQTNEDYVQADVYCNFHGPSDIRKKSNMQVRYPFNRFYMNENTIGQAEENVRQLLRDSTAIVYGEVMVKEGQARLIDIKSNGRSISQSIK